MSLTIQAIHVNESPKIYKLGEISSVQKFSEWLKYNGNPDFYYQLLRNGKIRSKWGFKDKTHRWGRV